MSYTIEMASSELTPSSGSDEFRPILEESRPFCFEIAIITAFTRS
jgi:hypothetical protein